MLRESKWREGGTFEHKSTLLSTNSKHKSTLTHRAAQKESWSRQHLTRRQRNNQSPEARVSPSYYRPRSVTGVHCSGIAVATKYPKAVPKAAVAESPAVSLYHGPRREWASWTPSRQVSSPFSPTIKDSRLARKMKHTDEGNLRLYVVYSVAQGRLLERGVRAFSLSGI